METSEQTECRICLVVKTDLNSSLCFEMTNSLIFQEIFLNLTGIDVLKTEEISSWICIQCENKLLDFDRFRKKCCESNDIFLEKAGNKTKLKTLNEKIEQLDSKLKAAFDQLEDDKPVADIQLIEDLSENAQKEDDEFHDLLKRLDKMVSSDESINEVEQGLSENVPKGEQPEQLGPVKVDLIKEFEIGPNFKGFQKVYLCPYCSKMFKKRDIQSVGSLMEHLNTDHPKVMKKTPIKENECKFCYRVLMHKIAMEAHIVSSHIRYCCQKCNKFFRDNEVPRHQKCQVFTKEIHQEINMKSVTEKATVLPIYGTTNCRSCLATRRGGHFINIFHSYPEIFLCCTGINITNSPGITTWMCGPCETKLNDFYNFQRTCWASDLVLRRNQITIKKK